MSELLHKHVKVVFNQSVGATYGLIGITCEVLGIDSGFIIVEDWQHVRSYYSLASIKTITIVNEKEL